MDLADRIIASSENNTSRERFFNYDLPEYDEYGMKTGNCPDYIVARIFYIIHESGRNALYFVSDDNRIWQNGHWVAEDAKNLYRLANWSKNITRAQAQVIWVRLRQFVKPLDETKLVLSDNLIWDKDKLELVELDNRPFVV